MTHGFGRKVGLANGVMISDRMCMVVKDDTVAASGLVARMQPRSARLGLVARELALNVTRAVFGPEVKHMPGLLEYNRRSIIP